MQDRVHHLLGHLKTNATSGAATSIMEKFESNMLKSNTAILASKEPRSEVEVQLRNDLAAAYRLAAWFGWEELIYNHFTCRIPTKPGEPERFLINSFGMGFDEVTASSLVTVDVHGNVIDAGSRSGLINPAGYVIHSAVHEARPDAMCVLHVHQQDVVGVSARKEGLIPVGQAYYALGEITTHDYEGLALLEEEKKTLVRDLGMKSKVMILKNHGCLTLGKTVAEAFILMYFLVRACEQQIKAGPIDQLAPLPAPHVQQLAGAQAGAFNKEAGKLEFALLKRRYEAQFGLGYQA